MKIVLTNLSNRLYETSRDRLNDSAMRFGIHTIDSYDYADIKKTDFYKSNQSILDNPKGAGAWLWKPYIILETAKSLNDGDIVIYCDCGLEIIQSLDPVIEICNKQQSILLFANGNLRNAQWTKRDTFILMDCDNKRYWCSLQCDASFGLFKVSKNTINFLSEWLECCKDSRILEDKPNVCGKSNLPGFIEHRWDQSVLSLLTERLKIPLYRMPTQFGNHYKSPDFRIKGEFNCVNQFNQRQVSFYEKKYYSNSNYYQLLNHHRTKNISNHGVQQKNTISFRRIFKKGWRNMGGVLFQWYCKIFT